MAHLSAGSSDRHFTTRRGFVAACGFGIVGLYGLWAGYGAAPLPSLPSLGGHGETPEPGGHSMTPDSGGHGPVPESAAHGAAAGPSPEEFRRLAEDFTARHRQPDGSVRPARATVPAMDHNAHGAHGMSAPMPESRDDAPLDVYFTAFQWGFAPGVLRLEAGRPYRLRMMAVDVTHGVALQFGSASRITRLRANTLVEQTMTFTRPGEHLVYCTVYCGPGHARMQSRLIVERAS